MNSLDLDGSREIIAGLVADYEAALDGDDIEKGMKCRWRLERWLWPLARWYLDHSGSENDEDDEDTGGEDLPSVKRLEEAIEHFYRVFEKHFSSV